MTIIKTTKVQKFAAIMSALQGGPMSYETDGGEVITLTQDELVAFCQKEIDSLNQKAAKAKETAAAKKAASDEMQEALAELLTEEPITIEGAVAALNDDEATRGKVAYRLNALVKDGRAMKSEITITDGDRKRRVTAYSLPHENF